MPKVVEVVVVEQSPSVVQYWSKDGKLLAISDPDGRSRTREMVNELLMEAHRGHASRYPSSMGSDNCPDPNCQAACAFLGRKSE
jgi:hypothetical protein